MNINVWHSRSALVSGTWSYRSTNLPGMMRVLLAHLFNNTNQREPIHNWPPLWVYILYCVPRMEVEVRNQSTQFILETSILLLYQDVSTPPLSTQNTPNNSILYPSTSICFNLHCFGVVDGDMKRVDYTNGQSHRYKLEMKIDIVHNALQTIVTLCRTAVWNPEDCRSPNWLKRYSIGIHLHIRPRKEGSR